MTHSPFSLRIYNYANSVYTAKRKALLIISVHVDSVPEVRLDTIRIKSVPCQFFDLLHSGGNYSNFRSVQKDITINQATCNAANGSADKPVQGLNQAPPTHHWQTTSHSQKMLACYRLWMLKNIPVFSWVRISLSIWVKNKDTYPIFCVLSSDFRFNSLCSRRMTATPSTKLTRN